MALTIRIYLHMFWFVCSSSPFCFFFWYVVFYKIFVHNADDLVGAGGVVVLEINSRYFNA